ncbi:MAG: TetR family transcriptional regulator [Akkermansiaceae bacterium]|nr:TetR family transcriptional regulator [Akkermansiaceae bacterium]
MDGKSAGQATKKIPGVLTERQEEKERVRERILDAAQKMMIEDGFRALSIRKLATRVQYSAGNIYLYFENRDAIARELCLRGYAEMLAWLEKGAATASKPGAKLRGASAAYLQFALARPEMYRLIYMDDPAYLEAVFAERREDDPATRAYELLIDLAAATLGAQADRPQAVKLAESCWAAMHGIASLKLSCPTFPRTSPEILCEAALDGLLKK